MWCLTLGGEVGQEWPLGKETVGRSCWIPRHASTIRVSTHQQYLSGATDSPFEQHSGGGGRTVGLYLVFEHVDGEAGSAGTGYQEPHRWPLFKFLPQRQERLSPRHSRMDSHPKLPKTPLPFDAWIGARSFNFSGTDIRKVALGNCGTRFKSSNS